MSRRLVTIGMSHYCEKARWTLDRAALPFSEDGHVPLLHVPYVRRAGGKRSTPVLVDGSTVVADSTDIFDHVQRQTDAGWKPWPDGADEATARALEADFDDRLGPHTRRYAYHHLLPVTPMLVSTAARFATRFEVRLAKLLRPLIVWAIRTSLKVTPDGAARSKAKIDAVFTDVSQKIAGRRYLVGDRLTAADVTFAALAAPVLYPAEYGGALPPFDELPPAFQQEVTAWRATPAGQFALRLFREDRAR
jgi:glutathione S-transferase